MASKEALLKALCDMLTNNFKNTRVKVSLTKGGILLSIEEEENE